MSLDCPCGGRFKRTDIKAVWSWDYNRLMFKDTDPNQANWTCNKCGRVRTQKKRQANQKIKKDILSLHS